MMFEWCLQRIIIFLNNDFINGNFNIHFLDKFLQQDGSKKLLDKVAELKENIKGE